MLMYNLIEQNGNYSKLSGSLWQCYRDKPALNDAGIFVKFIDDSVSLKFKQERTSEKENNCTKKAKTMVQSKYLSNFWSILKIFLINCEIHLILTWFVNCVISVGTAN